MIMFTVRPLTTSLKRYAVYHVALAIVQVIIFISLCAYKRIIINQFLKDGFYTMDYEYQLHLTESDIANPRRKKNIDMNEFLCEQLFFTLVFCVLEEGEINTS